MKKGTWRKHHKWLGIGMSFFMLMFCVSGILLNHRSLMAFTDLDECVYEILSATVTYLRSKNASIVSDTLNAYEWYKSHRKDDQ